MKPAQGVRAGASVALRVSAGRLAPLAVAWRRTRRLLGFAFAAGVCLANTAIEPVVRQGKAGWLGRHEQFVARARQGGIDVLFLGDSITDAWRNEQKGAKAIWDREFAPLGAANFGLSGDRTQHLLWRLENGELDGITPRAVVLMIGTNNTGFEPDRKTPKNTPAETAAGIAAIIRTIRRAVPETRIMLLAIFPRGEKPDDPLRRQVEQINAGIGGLHDGKFVHFLDIGAKFLAADGTLPKDVMPDFLHPNAKGYEIWVAAIKGPLTQMLK